MQGQNGGRVDYRSTTLKVNLVKRALPAKKGKGATATPKKKSPVLSP
jgi:hypothetical protein